MELANLLRRTQLKGDLVRKGHVIKAHGEDLAVVENTTGLDFFMYETSFRRSTLNRDGVEALRDLLNEWLEAH